MNFRLFATITAAALLTGVLISTSISEPTGGGSPTDLKWFNADHSPIGTWSSFVFGMKEKGGGLMTKRSTPPTTNVYVAYKSNPTGVKILPFVKNSSEYPNDYFYDDDQISRQFRLCCPTPPSPFYRKSPAPNCCRRNARSRSP